MSLIISDSKTPFYLIRFHQIPSNAIKSHQKILLNPHSFPWNPPWKNPLKSPWNPIQPPWHPTKSPGFPVKSHRFSPLSTAGPAGSRRTTAPAAARWRAAAPARRPWNGLGPGKIPGDEGPLASGIFLFKKWIGEINVYKIFFRMVDLVNQLETGYWIYPLVNLRNAMENHHV